ncbi:MULTISPECIES: DUF4124 domain-containing protein [unclassified Simplicispira]|uniref:DUF4124 domain-containing protein n=1 Tax=unclassified Simplicispira TaxID=2630407 RepID=UPI000D5D2BA5|nr:MULTISPECIES: DUF4124 domain-containing protein [unclassified Simplicispira]PVY57530.1 hypothetical protein C8D04_2823 [Simplicispira sp. 125]REG18474.1 hypothetical protein C8D01_3133 [Simplicispira sp. 110]
MKGDPLKRSVLKLLVGSVLAGLCAVVAAQNAPANTQSVYTCVDKQGRKLTSDRPIPECIDREQRELGPTGTVRRVIGPTLTDHERAALEVERRKEQEERNRIADERKRERVLLARYPDKASHDAERALALAQVDAVTATATQRIADLHGRRKTLDLEMEFYRKDPAKAPMMLRRQLAENDEEVQEQRRFIAGQDQEKRRIHQRFDEELAQLRKLWATQRPVPALSLPAPSTTAR